MTVNEFITLRKQFLSIKASKGLVQCFEIQSHISSKALTLLTYTSPQQFCV